MKNKFKLNGDGNLERKEKFRQKTIIKLHKKDLDKVLVMTPEEIEKYVKRLLGD